MPYRSTEEVFLDHLALAQAGNVDGDLERNFAPDCVLLTSYGNFSGLEGLREAAELLERQLGPANYTYRNKSSAGEMAFLEWTADTARASVDDGADSYVVRNGRIVAMTAHYTVRSKTDGA